MIFIGLLVDFRVPKCFFDFFLLFWLGRRPRETPQRPHFDGFLERAILQKLTCENEVFCRTVVQKRRCRKSWVGGDRGVSWFVAAVAAINLSKELISSALSIYLSIY